jgi:hypothetical protein
MRKPKTYFVETYRDPVTPFGVHFRVHKSEDFSNNRLHIGSTSVFRVEGASSKQEAVALVIEKFAGKNVRVAFMY